LVRTPGRGDALRGDGCSCAPGLGHGDHGVVGCCLYQAGRGMTSTGQRSKRTLERLPALRAVIRAEMSKVATLPWTWLVLAVAAVFVGVAAVFANAEVGVTGVAARDPSVLPDTFGMSWSVYIFMIMAAVVVGSDLRSGELLTGLITVPKRTVLAVAKLTVLTGLGLVFGTGLFAMDRVIRELVAGVTGASLLNLETLRMGVGYLVSLVVFMCVAAALTLLLRHAMVALAILLLFPFLVAPLLGRIAPSVSALLPHNASATVVADSGQVEYALGMGEGFALLAAWALVGAAVYTVVLVTRDN